MATMMKTILVLRVMYFFSDLFTAQNEDGSFKDIVKELENRFGYKRKEIMYTIEYLYLNAFIIQDKCWREEWNLRLKYKLSYTGQKHFGDNVIKILSKAKENRYDRVIKKSILNNIPDNYYK